MDDISRQAAEALKRLDDGEPLTREDASLVRPRLKRLADQSAIPFLFSHGLYVIEDHPFPGDDGGEYTRKILMSSQRTYEQDRYVSSMELYSRGEIGEYGINYTGDITGESWDDDEDGWLNPFHRSAPDQLYEDSFKQLMVAKAQALRDAGETAETSSDLAFYERELGITTYQGNVKKFVTPEERARQNVRKALTSFWDKMIANPDTAEIGEHLRKNIKTGAVCRYVGIRRWRFT